ncbi:hypothetical protein EJ06DRAFT_512441 [Trichodelitschia bisporula]|uniref:Nucleoporin-domain-containing protein n=1 Tax=Trichodelitschia bisporula TaxID=703511 RepID=A0A6G1HT75_9PEZI|nr:hypothetical protein EJ06DRAFT_512441 [Trichodelitschia bisporula]
MFSPDASVQSVHGASVRNPRRRRRVDDGLRQDPPKRSKISSDTYQAVVSKESTAGKSNGHAKDVDRDVAVAMRDMSVRDKRHASTTWRPPKSDGSVILTKNATYTVKRLPALPERMKTIGDFRAAFRSTLTAHHVVVSTQELVYIWDYTSLNPSPIPRILNLPESKRLEALPIAALVTTTSSSDIGIVIVFPTTGKIKFWENIDSAESLSLFQQRRQGIDGSIKLYTGESITQVIDIKHAGFILVSSSGRHVHLTIRDTQGRPSINTSILGSDGTSKGMLVNLYQTFKGGYRSTVVAVQARPSSTKGHMEVLSATNEGHFKSWEVSWAGHHMPTGDVDINDALAKHEQGRHLNTDHSLRLLDFIIIGPGKDDPSKGLRVMALVVYDEEGGKEYALLELDFKAGVELVRIIPINHYQPQTEYPAGKVYVPEPEHTAFVVFEREVVVVSLAAPATSSQGFQDVVHFKQEGATEIVEGALETLAVQNKHEPSSIVLLTKGAGVVRFIAQPPPARKDEERQRVTAKSKFEQAIFFGSQPGTILEFRQCKQPQFPQDEVEKAALSISEDILQTDSSVMPEISSSMDQHLGMRIKAAHDLVEHVKANYPQLKRDTRWRLMWSAERLKSAQSLWRVYEKWLGLRFKSETPLLMPQIIEVIPESQKARANPALGQIDSFRQWFVKDTMRLDKIIPIALLVLRDSDNKTSTAEYLEDLNEVLDMYLAILETALEFRETNARPYGLDEEDMTGGLLNEPYQGLPEFWTSRSNVLNSLTDMVGLFTDLGKEPELAANSHWQAMTKDLGRVVWLVCVLHTERYRWLLAQEDESTQNAGRNLEDQLINDIRPKELLVLASLGQGQQAMALAEKLGDIHSLVNILLHELESYGGMTSTLALDAEAEQTPEAQALYTKIHSYFAKFGPAFSRVFYQTLIAAGHVGALLDKKFGIQEQLSAFLRSNPHYAKLGFINDVINDRNMLSAAQSLHTAAEHEANNWCKTVQLSTGHLVLLAASSPDTLRPLQTANAHALALARIQTRLSKALHPVVTTSLDDDSALDNILESLSGPRPRPALHTLLRLSLADLLKHRALPADLLADTLSLLDARAASAALGASPWLLALQALHHGDLYAKDEQAADALALCVWKRLFVADDWVGVNATLGLTDAEVRGQLRATALYAALKEGYAQGLWLTHPAFALPLPPAALGAGSTAASLMPRFSGTDLAKPMAGDNAKDDARLRDAIAQGRLPHWYAEVVRLAEEGAEYEAVERGVLEREYAAWVGGFEHPDLIRPGGGVGVNGTGGGVAGEEDGDGDVEMEG